MFTNAAAPTPKGQRSRAHILEAALGLFEKKGYAATTLRDIAAAADVSLGLTYRYFRSKEDLVLALYADISARVTAKKLPEGTVAERFAALMEHKLRILAPHRESFGALLAAALDPGSRASVLGDATADIRALMLQAFGAVVAGATDAPRDPKSVALVLYGAHLALLLVWVHDRTRGARRTRALMTLAARALMMPPAVLQTLAGALSPILEEDRS